MTNRLLSVTMLVVQCGVGAAAAQTLPPDTLRHTARERAQDPYKRGMDHIRREDYPAALREFQAAVDIDESFEMAHYMIGRADLALRSYTAAVQALTRARDLYLSQGTTQFTSDQERQRFRRERINSLEVSIDALKSGPQSRAVRENIRQLEEQKRQIEDMDRARGIGTGPSVPAFVSLSLGSAYFRSGRMADAEREYKAAVAADPKSGEALSNLAVVYLESGRIDEADKAVKAAERTGFTVHPGLKDDIKKRKEKGSGSGS
jgi:Tfp pilus assembly protein PilF